MEPPQTISLMLSNVETIPGHSVVSSLGLVTGSTVRAKAHREGYLCRFEEHRWGRAQGLYRIAQRVEKRSPSTNDG